MSTLPEPKSSGEALLAQLGKFQVTPSPKCERAAWTPSKPALANLHLVPLPNTLEPTL